MIGVVCCCLFDGLIIELCQLAKYRYVTIGDEAGYDGDADGREHDSSKDKGALDAGKDTGQVARISS